MNRSSWGYTRHWRSGNFNKPFSPLSTPQNQELILNSQKFVSTFCLHYLQYLYLLQMIKGFMQALGRFLRWGVLMRVYAIATDCCYL